MKLFKSSLPRFQTLSNFDAKNSIRPVTNRLTVLFFVQM